MKVHAKNRISPLFSCCGLYLNRNIKYDWYENHAGRNGEVTCKNCKRTKLYNGDSSTGVNKLLER